MTGLDPQKNVIVEVATLITDDNLEIVAEGPDLVIHQPDEALAAMDKVVQQMHANSGLTEAIKASTISAETARKETLDFLQKHIKEARTIPLCGNSIGTDRRFLAQHWPDIEEFLHYRSVDVSTIKELGKRWYPETATKLHSKKNTHRALDDIKESIEELKAYRELYFVATK